jgi:hypothetical protein
MTKFDASTNGILNKLKPQKSGARPVTVAHAGIDSVHTGTKRFLKKGAAHTTPVKPRNAAYNAATARAVSPVGGPVTAAQDVAAGLTNATPIGTPFEDN